MSGKSIIRVAVLALVVLGVVALWPDLEAILILAAVVLVVGGVVAANLWVQRRRRRGEEASTFEPRGTIPFTGWGGDGSSS